MSEKRFIVENERTVYDNLFHRGYVCSWKMDAEELVGLLNSLCDENEQLRQQLNEMFDLFNASGLDYHISDELEEILDERG